MAVVTRQTVHLREQACPFGLAACERYYDDQYEYRHVVLPQEIAKRLPKGKLMSEAEWRAMGVQQSRGWVHYAIHRPEPHIMVSCVGGGCMPRGWGLGLQWLAGMARTANAAII
eukprot:scaffold8.g1369.t1